MGFNREIFDNVLSAALHAKPNTFLADLFDGSMTIWPNDGRFASRTLGFLLEG